MALKHSFMVANNTKGSDLSLTPNSGESLLVKKIFISDTESGYATVEISKATVGYYRMDSTIGNDLTFPGQGISESASGRQGRANIMEWLLENTDFVGYPVGDGETFIVTGSWSANALVTAVYEIYDKTDQVPSNPNGSGADVYHVINYIGVTGGVSAAGYVTYDDQITPNQFPAFPSVDAVPANTQIDILGIAGHSLGISGATAGDTLNTELVRLTKDRTVLWDEAKLGVPNYGPVLTGTSQALFGTGDSIFGESSNIADRGPFKPPIPLIYVAGDTLKVEQSFAGAGTVPTATTDQVAFGFIEKIHTGV